MFQESVPMKEFKRAKADLDAADKKVTQLQQRAIEIEQSVEISRGKVKAKTQELDAIAIGSTSLAEAEAQTRRIVDEQSKEQAWLDQQSRMRAALNEELLLAKAAAWHAEVTARQAQSNVHAARYNQAEREFLELISEPLRKLTAKAYLATFFAALLSKGEGQAAMFAVRDTPRFWDGMLAKAIGVLAAQPGFHDLMGIADQGTAPAAPVETAALTLVERNAARDAAQHPMGNMAESIRRAIAAASKTSPLADKTSQKAA